MDNLSFCNCCGSWVPPTTGSIQFDEGGKVVIVCESCDKLPQASPQSPNANLGASQVCLDERSGLTNDTYGLNLVNIGETLSNG